MTSKSLFKNLSLCIYIGNISSFDDQTLINYCSQYGEILSCSISDYSNEKRLFCDFRIIEFATKQQLDNFLQISIHKIGPIILDIKLYENLLNNFDILNIDRKIFIGPILNSSNINTIVQFYKLIDRNLQYYLSEQDKQIYILIEFSNRQYTRTIIQQKTIPSTIDNQIFYIHLPIHPKELIKKKLSTKNHQYQICIQGLTDQIDENILINYFEKRASVVACHILSTNPKSAIIEFENEKFVEKMLDVPNIHLYGTNLSLCKVSNNTISTIEYNNDEIDELLETIALKQNQSFVTAKPISIPAPEISECGWTSPPRAIIHNHCQPIEYPPERLSSKPSTTLTTMNTNIEQKIIEIDTKPMKNLTNNIFKFVEQFQNEIDQIKDEYMIKFTKDRTLIEHEINRLINDERITFDKLEKYSYEHRRRLSK